MHLLRELQSSVCHSVCITQHTFVSGEAGWKGRQKGEVHMEEGQRDHTETGTFGWRHAQWYHLLILYPLGRKHWVLPGYRVALVLRKAFQRFSSFLKA